MNNKILFIDDENEVINAYKKIFEKTNNSEIDNLAASFFEEKDIAVENQESSFDDIVFDIFTANQGIDGVKIVEENLNNNPIQVVFVDMRMPPGIDGAETAKRIRELDPKVEIVIVTAYSDTNLNDIVKKIGQPDKLLYLKKPFASEEIEQVALNLCVKYRNNQIKDDFLSSLSHELKTPLSSIIGFTDLLEEEEVQDEAKEFITIMKKNAHLMKVLIDDLFDISSISKKKVKLNLAPIRTKDILEDLYKIISSKIINDNNIEINFIPCEEEIYTELDYNRVLQCLINLTNNAIKFTDSGFVQVSCTQKEDEVYFSVQDTGIGIPQEQLEFIFDKFHRVENLSHTKPGLGLGLAITKELTTLQNGRIEVESTPGEGSLFNLIFPLYNGGEYERDHV